MKRKLTKIAAAAMTGLLFSPLGAYEKRTIPIVMDDMVIIVQQDICKLRPRVTEGTYLERFFNLPDIKLGDSFYYDGCQWQKTAQKCRYKIVSDGQLDVSSIQPSNLREHFTYMHDPVDGDTLVGCNKDSEYDVGEGFDNYNDEKIVQVFENELRVRVYTRDDRPIEAHPWLLQANEPLEKSKYPFSW